MKLVRSFPAEPPASRNYVVDDAVRLVNAGYDYRGLLEVGDDVIHLDWDTALSREDLVAFADAARSDPDRVLVAPVPIYPDSRRGLPATIWNTRRYTSAARVAMEHNQHGDRFCHLFGFGMLYLPYALIKAFCEDEPDGPMGDMHFALWHYSNVRHEVPLWWDGHPIHLHYRISEVPL